MWLTMRDTATGRFAPGHKHPGPGRPVTYKRLRQERALAIGEALLRLVEEGDPVARSALRAAEALASEIELARRQ